jgi:cell division septation protein DedD
MRVNAMRCAAVLMCAWWPAVGAGAQQTAGGTTVSAGVTTTVGRARALVDGGDGTAARTLLDSLVMGTESGTDDHAEALFWRAVLNDRAADAEKDWRRLVIESPFAPRVPESLLRLADLEILRGRPDAARVNLARLLRDFPESSHRPKAVLLTARSYFEERDVTHACETVASLRADDIPEGELTLQASEMRTRCAAAAAAATAEPAAAAPSRGAPANDERAAGADDASRTEKSGSTATRYTVQLAAYDTRAQATALVKRLAKRKITARVDGDRKPYRVRVGRYDTRAAAVAALARLKKAGQSGFIAELPK